MLRGLNVYQQLESTIRLQGESYYSALDLSRFSQNPKLQKNSYFPNDLSVIKNTKKYPSGCDRELSL